MFPFVLVEAAKLESGATILKKSFPAEAACADNNGDGVDDNSGEKCSAAAGSIGPTCGLRIVSGTPINYGQLYPGQVSDMQKVIIKNLGTARADVLFKAGDWISDAPGNPTISGPEITHVSVNENSPWTADTPLTSEGWKMHYLDGETSMTLYFHFKVPSGVGGSIHQDITLDILC